MKIFLIQHTKTGNFLPTDFNKGGTYWNGEAGKAPRVFHSYAAAASFMRHWAKGYAETFTETSGGFGEVISTGLRYIDQGRSRSDIRIREATIVLEPYQENLL